jgi:sterol desaturase/sphingolipid hydroxylase (fatty acid hydroxylase superfamily)
MWEIHKVHHSADEMNLVTSIRNHPIEQIIMSLLNAFSVALLGASPGVVISYYALNMVYQSLVHSEINHKSKLWDAIWITPAAHRIHHSNRNEHWDKNFGVMAIWDRIFGTYHPPLNERLTYGVAGGGAFNRSQHMLEIFDNVRRWLKPVFIGRAAEIEAPSVSDLAAPMAVIPAANAKPAITMDRAQSDNSAKLTPA